MKTMTLKEAKKLVNDIWCMYDRDNSGQLDRDECMQLFKDIAKVTNDFHFYEQRDKIIQALDKDGDGNLSRDELIDLILNYN